MNDSRELADGSIRGNTARDGDNLQGELPDGPYSVPTQTTLFALEGGPAKRRPAPSHPVFQEVNLDSVQYEGRLESAYRSTGLVAVLEPPLGLLTEKGLRRMAYSAPIHVMQRDGYFFCFGGKRLLDEARRVIKPPKLYPVLVYRSTTQEEIIEQTLIDEVVIPLWNRMLPKVCRTFVSAALQVAEQFSELLPRHTKVEWAILLRRSERSFSIPKK
ncbi:MAG: hypothetical protein WCE63_12915 [Acidobacteriaceae bacterium]